MEVLNLIKERRSINYFDTEKTISDEKLKELLELAALAPSSFNLQPWEVIAVRSPEKKKLLRECAFGQPKIEEASAVFIIIANTDAVEENLEDVIASMVRNGYTDEKSAEGSKKMAQGLYGAPDSELRKIFASKNAALFTMSLIVAAKGMGFDTHAMDGIDQAKIKEAFGIAPQKVVPMLVAVGYMRPGATLLPRNIRFSADRFAKFE